MKRLVWILVVPVVVTALLQAQEGESSQEKFRDDDTSGRMFFPRDMLWGWAQFDLAAQ
jgi:hypothetical protein